jgi:hypothetical protein
VTLSESSREADPNMGRPSDKSRAARRPGQRERARVKKHRRGTSTCYVAGACLYTLKAGRKKWDEFYRSRRNPLNMRNLEADNDTLAMRPSVGEPVNLESRNINRNGQPITVVG